MKQFRYKSIFAAKIKPLVQEETDKYLSLASNNLKELFPKDIDFEKKIDFLGFYGNLFVANRLNSNDDGISTKEALSVASLIPYSLLDVEHQRDKTVGVLTHAIFSSFGNNKILSKEEVNKLDSPFNVMVGGIIWRAVNPELADYIEANASDSDEPCYLSWELGFDKCNLIEISANKKNFEDGKIITDEKEIKKLERFLKSEGGKGYLDNGNRLGRIPIGEVLPIGAALTQSPAADVSPINLLSINTKMDLEDNNASISHKKCPNCDSHQGICKEIKQDDNITCNACGSTTKSSDWKGLSNISTKEAYDSKGKENETFNDSKDSVKQNTTLEHTITQNKINPKIEINPDYKFGKCPNCGGISDYNDFIKSWSSDGVITCKSCDKKAINTSWQFDKTNIWGEEKETANNKLNKKNKKILSHLENVGVKKDNKLMKFSSIKDITDDNLKEAKASEITEILNSEIKQISEKYEKDKNDKENLVKDVNKKLEEATANYQKVQTQMSELQANYTKLVEENNQKAKLDAFNARMTTLDSTFDLNDKEKEILASKIKSLDKDEDFTKFLEETGVLLAAKKKGMKPSKDNKDPDDDGDDDTDPDKDTDKDFAGKDKKDKKKESKASEDSKEVVDDAIKNGEKKEAAIANTPAEVKPSLTERMKANFGTENWSVEDKRKNRI